MTETVTAPVPAAENAAVSMALASLQFVVTWSEEMAVPPSPELEVASFIEALVDPKSCAIW